MLLVRIRARNIAAELRDRPDADILQRALATYEAGDTFLAYEILRAAPRALAAASTRHIQRLAAGLDGWAHVDCFACFASGVAWRLGRVTDATISRWARSRDLWLRRAAVVSTVPLNCRARGSVTADPARTLAICTLVLDDRDDMVVKALSWALRELAVRDPAPVRAFLAEHDARLAARVRREVTSKLTTGKKSPARKNSRSGRASRGRSP